MEAAPLHWTVVGTGGSNRCVHAGLFLLSFKFHRQSGFRRAASRRESQPQGLSGTKERVSSVHFSQDLVLKGKPSNWPLPTNNTKGGGAQELPTRFSVSRCSNESWVVKATPARLPVPTRAPPGWNEPWPLMTIRHLIRNCSDVTENTFQQPREVDLSQSGVKRAKLFRINHEGILLPSDVINQLLCKCNKTIV